MRNFHRRPQRIAKMIRFRLCYHFVAIIMQRREFLHALPALALGFNAGIAGQQDSADWPMFRGGVKLCGIAETKLPETLQLRWTYQAKESIESSAAIVDGVVYVGSSDGTLHAVDMI